MWKVILMWSFRGNDRCVFFYVDGDVDSIMEKPEQAGAEQPKCQLCGYQFDAAKLGKYGCPNCLGEGLELSEVTVGSEEDNHVDRV